MNLDFVILTGQRRSASNCNCEAAISIVPVLLRTQARTFAGHSGVYPSLRNFAARLLRLGREYARPSFAFNEDQMGVSGFRPAPRVEPDESERPGTNIPDPGRTRWESTLPFNVGPLRPSKGTHDDERETTPADDDLQSVDADDFRMWWEQGLAPTAAKGRWKLTLKGRALVGVVAIIGSVLALRGCAPSFDLFVDNGPALTQFPGDKSIAQSSDADAPSGKSGAQSARGKIAKEQLDDLSTQASPAPLPGGRSGDVRRI